MLLTEKLRKARLFIIVLILGTTQSGCASTLGSVFEAVVETTADAVVDITVDVAAAGAKMVVGAAVACIDNDRPVLSGALPNPVLNQEYDGTIHVGIRNEPYDNAYAYTFEVHGDFPPGMSNESTGRQLRLTGTPTLPGKYNFQIRVKVEDGLRDSKDTDWLCNTIDNEAIQWSIQQSGYATYAP